MFTLGDQSFR